MQVGVGGVSEWLSRVVWAVHVAAEYYYVELVHVELVHVDESLTHHSQERLDQADTHSSRDLERVSDLLRVGDGKDAELDLGRGENTSAQWHVD